MPLKITRPVTNHGQRLFYRTFYEVENRRTGGHFVGPVYHRPSRKNKGNMFCLDDPNNALCQMRLYRWMTRSYEQRVEELAESERRKAGAFSHAILKDDLHHRLFSDVPKVTKQRIGRILRMVVPYEISFQQNRSPATGGQNLMYWRWCHFLEIAYGVEHLMLQWLPELSDIRTPEDWEEEMQIIRDAAAPEEDYDIPRELRLRVERERDL